MKSLRLNIIFPTTTVSVTTLQRGCICVRMFQKPKDTRK